MRRWRSRMLWLRRRSLSSESELPLGLLSPLALRLLRGPEVLSELQDMEDVEEDEEMVLVGGRGASDVFCFFGGGAGSSSEAYGEGAA